MERFLLHKGFRRTSSDRLEPRAVSYLVTVLQHATDLGVRNERELRTLATAVDLLCKGDLPALGDVLLQRFKAIEMASQDASWLVASKLELIPPAQISSSAGWERQQAAQLELTEMKLRERLQRFGRPAKP
jgi:hypothetical protein